MTMIRTLIIGALLATAMPAAPSVAADSLLHRATFVHMVGRFYTIEKWVTEDLQATLVEIMPIIYNGNPAFRVVYVAPGSDRPTTVTIMAGGHGMELGDIEPIFE